MYPNREVFPAAPLALVVAEVRFTDAARLRQQQTKDDIAIALEGRFPFAEQFQNTDVNLAPNAPPHVQQRTGAVLKNTASTETITITSTAVAYETTAYTTIDNLLEAVTSACDAVVAANVRPALQRVGLRYIDEVRVPDAITDIRQWDKWVDRRLINHLDVGPDGIAATSTQGVATYDLGEGKGLSFRYAALDKEPVVVPPYLKRPAVKSGPFFVLDFDGFHNFTDDLVIPLDSQAVRESLSAVHVPCGTAFQRSITDEARTLFRGGQP